MAEPEYNVVNGTYYTLNTSAEVTSVLETRMGKRDKLSRIAIVYGDVKTGKAWGWGEQGYVGRTTGSVKAPLLCKTSSSMGGSVVMDDSILLITTTRGDKRVLYRHPLYTEDVNAPAADFPAPPVVKELPDGNINQLIHLLNELDGYGIVFENQELVEERLAEFGYRK